MSDGNGLLSQEEVDALLKNDSIDTSNDLTAEEKDVFGEIGNIAMGSAATALYTILNQKVNITIPEVKVSTFKEITEQYSRPCVLIKVEYVSGIKGVNLLIINEDDAAIIADLMMGGNGTNITIEKLDDIHISAVGEAMNQMMGSSATSLSTILEDVVNISPPNIKYLDLNEVIDSEGCFASDDLVVDASFQLKVGNLIDSSFKQLSPIKLTKELVHRLMDTSEAGGLTAKDYVVQMDEDNKEDYEEIRSQVEEKQGRMSMTTKAYTSNNITKDQNVEVKRAQFPDFTENTQVTIPQNMELIQDVPLEVTVRLGKSKMSIKEILNLGEGSIIELDKLAGEPVDLLVNGKLVAKGEVVVIDENFGFRVKDIVSQVDRINNI